MSGNYNANDIVSLSAGKATGYIYLIENDINNKVYIGKTTTSIEARFKRHYKDGRNEKNVNSIDYAINLFGSEHFKVKEVEKCRINLLSEREIYWIQYYNSYKNGYNLTLGGDGNQIFTEQEIILGLNMYQDGVLLKQISEKTGMSLSTLYKYIHSNNIKRREETQHQYKARVENFKKATKIRQVKVHNITLDLYYDSKKNALIDMIEKGYSKANDWHNIRAPLDKALNKEQKTFLGFEWEYTKNEKGE